MEKKSNSKRHRAVKDLSPRNTQDVKGGETRKSIIQNFRA
jgi:hypothetical protein